MNDMDDMTGSSIASRISRLNQLFLGRSSNIEQKGIVGREGLLDALLLLYDECNNDVLTRNQYIGNFVKKYATTVQNLRKLRISINDFVVKDIIGRGHFGEVQVVREKHSGDVYALKVLRKAETLAQQSVAFYEEERDIMAKSTSPWITSLQYAFQDKDHLYLVMEFHPGGDLLSLLSRYDDIFEESMARFYLGEMVLSVHALHTMGYVHRDVKPENILIDRTGHIKLADFGSACRITDSNSSVANMPVGTPDYISPEVLMKMNSDNSTGKFGEECDWWSLGVCAYEMLYGNTPFTSEAGSMVATYASIMNFKKKLKFPNDTDVSRDAIDLIKHLLTDARNRLTYEGICVHGFFTETDFDNLRHTTPPFIPTVTSRDDTSNFEEFEKIKPKINVGDLKKQTGFSGKDLPFVGFTFTKTLSVERNVSFALDVASPAGKSSFERRLSVKTKELQDFREKYKQMEHKEISTQMEMERLRKQLSGKEDTAKKLEIERDALERDISHYMSEISSLKRLLDLEKQERLNTDNRAMKLLEEIREQAEQKQQLKDENNRVEIEEHKEIIEQMEEERRLMTRKIDSLEKEVKRYKMQTKEKDSRVVNLQSRLSNMRENTKMTSEELSSALYSQEKEFSVKESEWQIKLDQAIQQSYESMELLQKVRDSKANIESELECLKVKIKSEDTLRCKLNDSEEKRHSLETRVHRLSLLEKRESGLKEQLNEKSLQIAELSEKISELEDVLRNKDLEHNKHERMEKQRCSQLEYRVQELEDLCDKLKSERSCIEDQSLMVFEENEDRLRKIQDQEGTINAMKSNIKLLEVQVDNLRVDLEHEALHRTPRKTTRRISGCCQTDFNSPALSYKNKRRSNITQTDKALDISRRSMEIQTDMTEPCSKSVGLNTSHYEEPVSILKKSKVRDSPRKSNNDINVQTSIKRKSGDGSKGDRYSVNSQSRRSSKIQTVSVSVSFGGVLDETNNSTMTSGSSTMDSSCNSLNEAKLEDPINETDEKQATVEETEEWDDAMQEDDTENWDQEEEDGGNAEQEEEEDWEEEKEHNREEEWEEETTVWGDDEDKTDARVEMSTQCVMNQSAAMQTEDDLEYRELRRKYEETISDLKQNKLYLELKSENLQRELGQIRDNTHQQRIRALDLKQEIREKTELYERQLDELRTKANKAELQLGDAMETANNFKEKESTLKNKVEKLQRELDTLRFESRRNISRLQEERDEFDLQTKSMKRQCESFEKLEADYKYTKKECEELAPKNKDLEFRLQSAIRDKTRFKLEADKAKDELGQKRRECEHLEQRVQQLKSICTELDSQVQDYETLNSKYEKKETEWTQHRSTYSKAVDEREEEINDMRQNFNLEKIGRKRAEDKQEEVNRKLQHCQEDFAQRFQSARSAYQAEINDLREQLREQREKANQLNVQLTSLERKHSKFEVECKSLQRKLEASEDERYKLKEETSKLITKTNDLKASNLKVGKSLEESIDRYEVLANLRIDLENRMENVEMSSQHEKYKLESTIGQQTKLIDYLQVKVENPPKKKKGIFGNKKDDKNSCIQFREVHNCLEHEREKNTTLRQDILKLRDELYQAKTETIRLKCHTSIESLQDSETMSVEKKAKATPLLDSNKALSTLVMSPQDLNFERTNVAVPKSPRQRERMKHNIPHRFLTGLNSKPTKCAVCLGSVHFVKHAAKCQECHVVCHTKCAPSLPATCGLPTEYAQHFTEVIQKARSRPMLSVADLNVKMKSWMKIPRAGKQIWEKRWVVLEDNKVLIFDKEKGESQPMDEFDLCPTNGGVTIHSAVTAAELTNTASSDLPFILRLEFEPETTCWPGRMLYLMALNFSDKQRWVAILEAITTDAEKEDKSKDAKLLGNTILSITGEKRLEINCTLILSSTQILIGCDEGLYSMQLSGTAKARPLVKIEGLASVYQMETLDGLDCVLMITDREDRDLVMVDMKPLQRCFISNPPKDISIIRRSIDGATAVTTFALGHMTDGIYACIATAEKILMMKFLYGTNNFTLKKEILISQACSCLYFGPSYVILGTDKFYKIDMKTYNMAELLSKKDSSLAFAVFGAAHYESFPIEVLDVAEPGEPDEYLLCYHEFGLFVDSRGRRTREGDLKWNGLPLAFAYEAPYLYVTHFSTLQVMEILPPEYEDMIGAKTFINLTSPRYLGAAISKAAVYIGSCRDNLSEILCFKGNMETRDAPLKENKNIPNLMSPTKSKNGSPSKKRMVQAGSSTQSGIPKTIKSPARIQTLQESPKRRVSPYPHSITESSDMGQSSSTGGYSHRGTRNVSEKRRKFTTDSDTSF